MTPERKTERMQRRRVRFLLVGLVSYGMGLIICVLAASTGVLAWRHVVYWLLMVATIKACLFGVFRSGLNLRFKSPDFTEGQVLLALVPSLYVAFHAETSLARSAILLITLSALLYGVLGLSRRRFLCVTGIYFIGYLGLLFILGLGDPDVFDRPGAWMLLIALGLFMLQIGLMGGFINRLRLGVITRSKQIADMARHDELTQCFNRRYLIDVLSDECRRANRGGIFGVCLIDIDYFKRINDEYGHGVGDEVLRRCAAQIQSMIRDVDVFGRYGGEEFLLILPQTRGTQLRAAAERVRRAVEELMFDASGDTFQITISAGIAEGCADEFYGSLLKRVDDALYAAKRGGRNRVHWANDAVMGSQAKTRSWQTQSISGRASIRGT